MSANNAKVFKSSIVPKGERIEPVRSADTVASTFSIEVVHIICFIIIFLFLFLGLWKKAVASEKKA